ncbi:MAG: hypothetical protein PUE85_08320 [Firmicutes bacterium]|nr:hypothetical protein [Bacillota bacterium]
MKAGPNESSNENVLGKRRGFSDFFTGFILIFTLTAARFTAYGFTYFKQLDDYIQYGIYPTFTFSEAQQKFGLLAARPLSNSADIVFWGKFWGCLAAALLIIAALFSLAAVILKTVFSRFFGTGPLFAVILALIPLNFEGTYWLSASTRIVCGMFWAALSAWLLLRFAETEKIRFALLFPAAQLAAMFSYEQAFLFSAALNAIVAFLCIKKCRKALLSLPATLLSGLLYFIFIKIFSGGPLYSGAYAMPDFFSADYYEKLLPKTAEIISETFSLGIYGTVVRGAARGIRFIVSDRLWIFASVSVVLCAVYFIVNMRRKNETGIRKTKTLFATAGAFFAAAWLCAAPLDVFFIMAEPYFSMRNTVMCLPGIALAADSALRAVFRKPLVPAAVSAAAALVFSAASVSELHDYRETAANDSHVINAVISDIGEDSLYGKIGILNVEMSYLTDSNCLINEHITGVTSSYWALTGAVNATLGARLTGKVTIVPLPSKTPMCYRWNYDMNRIDGFDRVYFYIPDESRIIPVVAKEADGGFIFADENGKTVAKAFPDGDVWLLKAG